MKTEDIDKKIGMPDVDEQWAKFEREVIDTEGASHKRIVIWGFSIAASIALVAGIFLFGHTPKETEQLQTELTAPTQQVTTQVPEDKVESPDKDVAAPSVAEPQSSEKLLAETTPTEETETTTQPTTSEPVHNSSTEKIYSCEEVMPYFPGGPTALKQFIEENLRYPDLAKEYGAAGRIIVTFIVDTLGQMNDIKVIKSLIKFNSARFNQESADRQAQLEEQITEQLNQEALRIIGLISQTLRWTPGTQFGKPVRVKYNVPVIFRAPEPDVALAPTYFSSGKTEAKCAFNVSNC